MKNYRFKLSNLDYNLALPKTSFVPSFEGVPSGYPIRWAFKKYFAVSRVNYVIQIN